MEEWRDVPGGNGKYQINIDTKEGRCRAIYKNGKIRELNHTIRNKRIFWCLTINKKEIFQQAARWIAITYPELVQNEYFEGAEICHEDNDSLNNHPSNLRWGTHKYNMNNKLTRKQHSEVIKGNHFHLGKKNCDESKLKMHYAKVGHVIIGQFTIDGEFVASYPTIAEAVRQNTDKKLNNRNISECCNGKRRQHAGYVWKYLKEAV